MTKEMYLKTNKIILQVIRSLRINYPYCLTKDDLIQAAWMRILKYRARFDQTKSKYETYIYMIARQQIISYLYKYGSYNSRESEKYLKTDDGLGINFRRITSQMIEGIPATKSESNQFEDENELSILRDIIYHSKMRIKKVSDLHLKCFEMHFEQDCNAPSIAAKLGLENKKVKGMIDYAIIIFRAEFIKLLKLYKKTIDSPSNQYDWENWLKKSL